MKQLVNIETILKKTPVYKSNQTYIEKLNTFLMQNKKLDENSQPIFSNQEQIKLLLDKIQSMQTELMEREENTYQAHKKSLFSFIPLKRSYYVDENMHSILVNIKKQIAKLNIDVVNELTKMN